MLRLISLAGLIAAVSLSPAFGQQTHVDLADQFDTDVVLEPGGEGLTDYPFNDEDRRIDGGTLPGAFMDGEPNVPQDGGASLLFAPLLEPSLDAMFVDGQALEAPAGNYQQADLAMVAGPGSYGDPFGNVTFEYTDGTVDSFRFGPVAGWFASPTAFDNTLYQYTDDSNVETIIDFATDWGEDDTFYALQEEGVGDNGFRFVDGTGFLLYELPLPEGITEGTLGIEVGNNFKISLATEYHDPAFSTEEGFTVIANSMEIYDGFEHRSLGNLQLYEFDVSDFLQGQPFLYVLFTDATPDNGWGPHLESISLFTGELQQFAETLEPRIDASEATVHAMFQTNGGEAEQPYLYDNNASGPTSRGHRYADGNGSLTYQFDLPDDVDADATNLVVDMANNFVVSLSPDSGVTRYASMFPGTPEEDQFLIDAGNSSLGASHRFADGESYMTYQFDLPDDLSEAVALINMGNQFVVEIASGTDGEFALEQDYVAETGEEPRDMSNLDTWEYELAPYLQDNPENIVRIRLSDGVPSDGWGPSVNSIVIADSALEGEGQAEFTPVLSSMELFNDDIHNEYNKDYYTIPLADVLSGNDGNEFLVRFTDGSTEDGWGPGVFWMAVYSGTLEINGGGTRVFDSLKATSGAPENYGVSLLKRTYPLDPTKTLQRIAFPPHSDNEGDDAVYLMGATLVEGEETPVVDWMLQ